MGALSEGEAEQVAGAMCRFAEVRAEVAALEAILMSGTQADAIAPPPGLDDKIWAAIEASAPPRTSSETPAANGSTITTTAPKIIPLGRPQSRRMAWPLAASLALLIGSLAANFIFWDRGEQNGRELAALQTKTEEMSTKQQALTASLSRYQKEADLMAQPGMLTIPMQTTQKDKPMAATMYWDKAKGEAYVSVQKLPPPPAGMQYQLWAIADGKPVDIGMMENEIALTGGMQKVPKSVLASQAFAISLEKAGGSPTPTAERIYVLGKAPTT